MTVQRFDPHGVTEKISELRALPDDRLRKETKVLRDNFRIWLINNFEFEPEQQDYLAKMEEADLQNLAVDIGAAMDFRLPFYVTFHPKIPGSSKFIKGRPEGLERCKDQEGNEVVTGLYRIEIIYE